MFVKAQENPYADVLDKENKPLQVGATLRDSANSSYKAIVLDPGPDAQTKTQIHVQVLKGNYGETINKPQWIDKQHIPRYFICESSEEEVEKAKVKPASRYMEELWA